MTLFRELSLLPERVMDYLHSLRFCLRVFGWRRGWLMPVVVAHDVRLEQVWRGCVVIEGPWRRAMVRLGQQGYEAVAEGRGLVHFGRQGRLVVRGRVRMGQGIRLWVDDGATLTLGDDFYCNKNCLLRVADDVTFGRGVLMGWDVEVNTTDGHHIAVDGVTHPNRGPICVGSDVWVASHVVLAKGAVVPDGSVVAQRSVVTSAFAEAGVLLGGVPARVLRRGVTWQR